MPGYLRFTFAIADECIIEGMNRISEALNLLW